jgi:two-component system, NtrC family, sensor histidine kinase HydH
MLASSKNQERKKGTRALMGVPPWILLGAVLILTPIFIFWAAQNIRRQEEMTNLLLLEKGAALIRSFEAGARTGMMGMMGMDGNVFRLQLLLTETAQQPGIVYLGLTDHEGRIAAHTDQGRIGEIYDPGVAPQDMPRRADPLWRRAQAPDGTHVFEVFRKFSSHPARFRRPGGERGPARRGAFTEDRLKEPPEPGIIFVGLDISPFEEARREEARHTVAMAVILLLIGFAGIFSMFVVQAYRSARSSLTRIQAFSEHVIQNMPMGLVALDGENRVVSFNRTASAMLGIPAEHAPGRPAPEILPAELAALVREEAPQGRILDREVECAISDGRHLPLAASVSTLKGPEGESAGKLLLFRDMTEVRALKKEVERTRRLAAVGRLAAGVAHEVRNPLSSIKGFATYFKERYRDVEEDHRTAAVMVQEVDRLNRVIGQLLEFARPMDLERKPVQPDVIVRHALKMIEAQARGRGVEVFTRAHSNPVPMDADRMTQVLLNLLLNGLEAMPGGGRLSLTVDEDDTNRYARFTVRDTGKGIGKDDLAHVFDPYFTTKPSGTGLGLAVVHKIVESHGGEIQVESEEGKGAAFTVLIPLDPESMKPR